MLSEHKRLDYLGALCILVAFGGLFMGRVVMYPVALVQGSFLERLSAEPGYWDYSHRVLMIAAVATIPAALALSRALRERSKWLCDIGLVLLVIAATLCAGQFALDYAMLAASQLNDRTAGQEFVDRLMHHPFVEFTFYNLANVAWIGVVFYALAMWRQGWRAAAITILISVVMTQFESSMGPIGPRIARGICFAGFALAAWRIATEPEPEESTAQPT